MSIVPKALRFTGKFAAVALVATMAVAAARPGWTTYVVQTEGGGHRLGNPAAKALQAYLNAIVQQLESEAQLPEKIERPQSDEIDNPFL